jgi:hypothetical protein
LCLSYRQGPLGRESGGDSHFASCSDVLASAPARGVLTSHPQRTMSAFQTRQPALTVVQSRSRSRSKSRNRDRSRKSDEKDRKVELLLGVAFVLSVFSRPSGSSVAICNLQFAICNLRFAICNLQFAICNLRFAICNLQFASALLASSASVQSATLRGGNSFRKKYQRHCLTFLLCFAQWGL